MNTYLAIQTIGTRKRYKFKHCWHCAQTAVLASVQQVAVSLQEADDKRREKTFSCGRCGLPLSSP